VHIPKGRPPLAAVKDYTRDISLYRTSYQTTAWMRINSGRDTGNSDTLAWPRPQAGL